MLRTGRAGQPLGFYLDILARLTRRDHGDLCYTPIQRILSTLHVELPTGSFATADRVVG